MARLAASGQNEPLQTDLGYGPATDLAAPFRGTGMGVVLVSPGRPAMKLQRRRFMYLAAGAAALPTLSRYASAQTYPARTITIIVPYWTWAKE